MRKEMLKAAKMPPAKKEAEDDMLSMEGMEDEGEPAEAGAGEESPAEEAKELAAMPDEMLLAELKKRGYEVESSEEEAAEGEESEGEVIAPKGKPASGMPAMKKPAPAKPSFP